MRILSFSSSSTNNSLKEQGAEVINIGEKGIIETIYNKNEVKEVFKSSMDISTLEDLDKKCEIVIFDFISLTNNYYRIKNMFFSEQTLEDFYDNQSIDKLSSYTDIDEFINIFKEAFKIIINNICRFYHPSEIVLLNIEDIILGNTFLQSIFTEAKKIVPGCIEINIKTNKEISVDLLKSKVDEIKIFKGEKVHTSLNNIRYVFKKANISNKDKLVVIFSAFSTDIPKYNYISFLKTIDCNKLFILDDYGQKGSYYLGLDGNMEIETSVISLIMSIMSQNDITLKNVIAVGSSKGGSAALYYGFKYGFGNIIAGAPQYRIGSYLLDLSIKQYALDIFGEISDSKRIKYDNLIRLNLTNANNTKAKILTSDGDNQYLRVLKPIENEIQRENYKITIEKCEINNHGEISKVYPEYLLTQLENILEGKGVYSFNPIFKIIKKLRKRGN